MKLKKVLAVSLAAAMTLSMAACGSNEGTSSTDSGKALKPDHRYSDENEPFAGRSRCDLSECISGKPGCVSVDRIYAAVSGRILCGTVKDC